MKNYIICLTITRCLPEKNIFLFRISGGGATALPAPPPTPMFAQ